MEKSLMGPPSFPRLQRAGGSFMPRHLLMRTQVMEMMYEEIRDAVPREAMALKATVEPMLIRERRIVMRKEINTAFNGMSHPGRTWKADQYLHADIQRGGCEIDVHEPRS